MCGKRDITFIDHTDTIDTERHINESKVYLNKSGTIEFAKNVCEYLLQQINNSADNSGNTALGSEKSSTVSGVTQYLSIVMRSVNQILFVTLAINLYGGIKF